MKTLGMDAVIYYDETPLTASGASAATWLELGAAREVTTAMASAEADGTSRANDGWRATFGGLKDAPLDFELVWDRDDVGVQAILDAFLGNTDIALAALDGPIATAGVQGLAANFRIVGFSRSEPLEDMITVAVSAKPSSRQEWFTVTS